MLKIIAPYFVIFGSAMHLFCCGIPLFLGLTSLTTIFGISSLSLFEVAWFEAIEIYVLVASGIFLLISLIVDFICKKLDCSKTSLCQHPHCENKKTNFSYLLKIAVIIYAINLLTKYLHTLAV